MANNKRVYPRLSEDHINKINDAVEYHPAFFKKDTDVLRFALDLFFKLLDNDFEIILMPNKADGEPPSKTILPIRLYDFEYRALDEYSKNNKWSYETVIQILLSLLPREGKYPWENWRIDKVIDNAPMYRERLKKYWESKKTD